MSKMCSPAIYDPEQVSVVAYLYHGSGILDSLKVVHQLTTRIVFLLLLVFTITRSSPVAGAYSCSPPITPSVPKRILVSKQPGN